MRDAVVRRVQYWITGPGVVYPGDSRQRIIESGSSFPTFRTFQIHDHDGHPIQIGRFSGLQSTATIVVGGEHHTDWVGQLHAHKENGQWVMPSERPTFDHGPVVIGNDVWVGFEALITSGVTIGDGAVVGARTVLRRDVAPYEIVVGNPARTVGFRFEQPIREALLRIRWWDWTDEVVERHKDQIHSPDIESFIALHDPELGPVGCPACAEQSADQGRRVVE